MTPIKSIRAKCLDCCCNQPSEVRLCPSVNCPLWPFRMGKRPKTRHEAEVDETAELSPVFFAGIENLEGAE